MRKKQVFRSGPLLGIVTLALIWVASAATPANALVAAGTTIANQATVSYAEGTSVNSNIVNTTVNLISGLAWDDTSLSPVTQTEAPNSALTSSYTVDLINLGNGATTATITDGTTQSDGSLSAGTWTINGVTSPSVVLGATVSSGAAVTAGANTNIPVSFVELGAAGLEDGDRVLINGTEYTVVGAGSTSTNLVVIGDATTDVAAAGVPIGEIQEITFTGTTGSLTSPTQTHDHSMTASDQVGATGLNSSGNAYATDTVSSNTDGGGGTTWQTTVIAGTLTIDKYVRNATAAVVGGGSSITYDGSTYYQSGVTGDSGATPDTLEYLIVVTNAGPGAATAVTVTDTISTYLSLDTTSVDIDSNGDGTFDIVDAINVAQDAATFAGQLLTVYAGVGGIASTTTGGDIAFDLTPTSAVRFQADIQ